MIVRMSKVEIAGPRGLLEKVISLLQEMGMLQIEPSTIGFIEKKDEAYIDSFLPDKETLSERLFLEDLKAKLEELFLYLSDIPVRNSYIEPRAIIDTIKENLQKHLLACREISHKREGLQKELDDLGRYSFFLDAIEPLLKSIKQIPDF